jgi:hypothetical protein
VAIVGVVISCSSPFYFFFFFFYYYANTDRNSQRGVSCVNRA